MTQKVICQLSNYQMEYKSIFTRSSSVLWLIAGAQDGVGEVVEGNGEAMVTEDQPLSEKTGPVGENLTVSDNPDVGTEDDVEDMDT